MLKLSRHAERQAVTLRTAMSPALNAEGQDRAEESRPEVLESQCV